MINEMRQIQAYTRLVGTKDVALKAVRSSEWQPLGFTKDVGEYKSFGVSCHKLHTKLTSEGTISDKHLKGFCMLHHLEKISSLFWNPDTVYFRYYC